MLDASGSLRHGPMDTSVVITTKLSRCVSAGRARGGQKVGVIVGDDGSSRALPPTDLDGPWTARIL
jgi:hypothetical protein